MYLPLTCFTCKLCIYLYLYLFIHLCMYTCINVDAYCLSLSTFSKLTLSEQCRLTVSATPLYLSLLPTALATHVKNEEIVLRVCFILDNISRDSTDISVTLCHTHDLVSSLNQVLLLYGGTNTNSSKATDVLIKVGHVIHVRTMYRCTCTCTLLYLLYKEKGGVLY